MRIGGCFVEAKRQSMGWIAAENPKKVERRMKGIPSKATS